MRRPGLEEGRRRETLIEDPSLSIDEGVFGSFFGKSNDYPEIFRALCAHLGVEPRRPERTSPPACARSFLIGLGDKNARRLPHPGRGDTHWLTKYSGVRNILYERYVETTNENTKARLSATGREEPCTSCHGARLRPRCSRSPWAASP